MLPCYPYFYLRVFDEGIFNFFDDYYARLLKDEKIPRRSFREYFGYIYENYVFEILKKIFDDVHKIDTVAAENKTADFRINLDNKIYLLEVKSLFVNSYSALLDLWRPGQLERQIERIAEGVRQLYNSYQEEKSKNTSKGILPVLILNNSSKLFLSANQAGSSELNKALRKEKVPDDFRFRYLDFTSIERNFDALEDASLSIEDISSYNDEPSIGPESVMPARKEKPGNSYFDNLVQEFFESILETKNHPEINT